MPQPLEAKVADSYAQHVKDVISGTADEAALITSLTTVDELSSNQNARLYQSLKLAIQSRAFTQPEATIIKAAIESLGFAFELDEPV